MEWAGQFLRFSGEKPPHSSPKLIRMQSAVGRAVSELGLTDEFGFSQRKIFYDPPSSSG